VIEAAAAFIARHGGADRPTSAVLAVAGPVENGHCEIINSRWVIDADALRTRLGFARVRLLNDFEAIAWSLPKLGADDLRPIGGGRAQPNAPKAILGPGTGLGIAAVLPNGLIVPTEAGHASLAGNSEREDAVIASLRRRFGRVSAERALSGPGLQNLYQAIAELDHVDAPARSAAEITSAAIAGTCPVSKATLDMFCALLGTVAGDVALVFRARGGVYLAGGIVPRVTDHIARSEFRARFEAKGRMRPYVEAIPTSVILHADPAFLGLLAVIEAERPSPPLQA
jgi:glucokinase